MKFSKDLLALFVSQFMLLALIGLWLNSVYRQELDGLKAETNVIFFNALEEAKEKLFFSRVIHEDSATIKSEFTFSEIVEDDSVTRREIIVFEGHNRFTDSIHHERLGNWINKSHLEDSTHDFEISIEGSNISRILVASDSILDIDFDTTKSYLTGILEKKVNNSSLRSLKVRVLDHPHDTSFQSAFLTNSGKLGNILFGTTEYAASVANYDPVILKRMIPEFGMGLLIFLVIFSAFIIIYKNLLKERRLAQLKDDFISNVSHELKTPISVVNVAIEALNNFEVLKNPEKTKEYLNISKMEMNRLTGMVDQILNISVLSNESSLAERSEVSLQDLLQEVLDSMNLKSMNGTSVINFTQDGADHRVLVDPSQLKSVFFNLLDNAQKYGSGEEINLSLTKSNGHSVIEVLNKGEGIPKEYQDQVFEKFFRVPNKNLHKVKGYGLGLYNVKKIVEDHDGVIVLESGSPDGTMVSVKLQNVK